MLPSSHVSVTREPNFEHYIRTTIKKKFVLNHIEVSIKKMIKLKHISNADWRWNKLLKKKIN